MTDPVRLDAGDVATITVDRPEKLNALTVEALDAFDDTLDAAEDAGARAVIVTGSGDTAFVAGADIAYMRDLSTEGARAYTEKGHRLMRRLEDFPAPVIAAINGYAFGGGMELALACDIRVASERAVLGQTEIDLGIIPGWGGTQRLPRLVGDELARRLIFFGERVDAQDAMEYGIVGDVVAHDELSGYVDDFAADLAAKPRHALSAAKSAITQSVRAPPEAGLGFERTAFAGLFGTPDQREGMAAFVEDRDPDFE